MEGKGALGGPGIESYPGTTRVKPQGNFLAGQWRCDLQHGLEQPPAGRLERRICQKILTLPF